MKYWQFEVYQYILKYIFVPTVKDKNMFWTNLPSLPKIHCSNQKFFKRYLIRDTKKGD